MKKFLVLYTCDMIGKGMSVADMIANSTPEQMEAGMALWAAWYKKCGPAIVDLGTPTGNGAASDGTSAGPSKLPVSGYSILQAASIEDAQKLMEGHPHFHMPGSGIDIFECLSMPIPSPERDSADEKQSEPFTSNLDTSIKEPKAGYRLPPVNLLLEPPIPGNATIGGEIPNASPLTVTLRELCDDATFQSSSAPLFIALGKDLSGVATYIDLTKMPQVLIGGAKDSGKSIGLATLITSLLMRNTPKEVRMILIDPKGVELTHFDHIPHLMCPVIKDVDEAARVLQAVWREMDRRYDLFSSEGVRNIGSWNARATIQDRLPYIVVVIDELGDLMIQCGTEVETAIVRLVQLARAVGIHMVIATQLPSINVITDLINENIPSRIAFKVGSSVDSRKIIDLEGAENLIGRGDMLFKPIEAIKPMRIQGVYVTEKEIATVCRFWREQQSPG